MNGFKLEKCVCAAGAAFLLAAGAAAQYNYTPPPTTGMNNSPSSSSSPPVVNTPANSPAPPYGGGPGGSPGGAPTPAMTASSGLTNNYHVSFDRPEAWGMKYFAAATLLSGLQPAEPVEGFGTGAITVGIETGWLPMLDAGQQRIGYNGTSPEDLNKAPVFIRPVVRFNLPNKFTVMAGGPPPFEAFGITPHLLAFGVERPILEADPWTLRWRSYGQLGSVKGAFTCPASVLGFAPGSPQNPTQCIGQSADRVSLRYAGTELDLAYRIPNMPKVIPHVTADGNFIDGAIQLHAPTAYGLDQTRLWTRGVVFSTGGGISYLVSKRATFTVDASYTPLWVRRSVDAPVTNDGLFNVRALMTYTFR